MRRVQSWLTRLAAWLQRQRGNRRGFILLRFPLIWAMGAASAVVAVAIRLVGVLTGDAGVTKFPNVRHAYECTYPSGELTRMGGSE